jgi:16S rRNA (guanine527-N7)-methyltransferase
MWDIAKRFREEAALLGVHLDEEMLVRFCTYLDELRQWNRVVRLVSCAEVKEVVWLHFMDSLTPLSLMPEEGLLVDIGSGAGFPGVPIKIARPSLHVTLVEAKRKKANFLRHLSKRLALEGVRVHEGRAEEMESSVRFDIAISRASAPAERWIPWALRQLSEGGRIIVMTSQEASLDHLRGLADDLHLEVMGVKDVLLPVVGRRRRVVAMCKKGRFT